MHEVSIEMEFSSAHALRGYRGKCENTHGHNYKVEVHVRGENLDHIGLLVDFRDVTFIDSSAIGIIVGAQRRCASDGRQLLLVNVSGPPLRVLTLLGLGRTVSPPLQPAHPGMQTA